MALDPLTVADDPDFLVKIANEPNVPDPVVPAGRSFIEPTRMLASGSKLFVEPRLTPILLIGPSIGRAWIVGRGVLRTVIETVSIGVVPALAGVATTRASVR